MSKQNKNRERREMVEQMRRQARAAERRRTMVIFAICVVVALIITGAAIYTVVKNNREQDRLAGEDLASIGEAAQAAGCTSIKEQDASGQGQHTTEKINYAVVPPAFGPHNPTPDQSGKHFFTADDRPDVEVLVHNEEHGWTIVWYDDSIAGNGSQMDLLQATADKFDSAGSDFNAHVIIAPWTKDDGNGRPIPDNKHIAFTHWSIHQPNFDPKKFKQDPSWGESQYCDTFSGAALNTFMQKFPYDDAPEGSLWHQ
ncbi:MAG TPA: DUF3105 domain-containing protein [Nocardioidaceae bacterium]